MGIFNICLQQKIHHPQLSTKLDRGPSDSNNTRRWLTWSSPTSSGDWQTDNSISRSPSSLDSWVGQGQTAASRVSQSYAPTWPAHSLRRKTYAYIGIWINHHWVAHDSKSIIYGFYLPANTLKQWENSWWNGWALKGGIRHLKPLGWLHAGLRNELVT